MKPNYRRCVSCRAIAHKRDLLRVVRLHNPQRLQLDIGMGRSAYLCPTSSCLQTAHKKKQLSRALRVPVSDEIYDLLAQQLENLSKRSEN
ncbi:MAG: YlxR family protein [Leptolyngbyaceae cyanobacterium]